MPEVYGDPRQRPRLSPSLTVKGEQQQIDKEKRLHPRGQRQQHHLRRLGVESGSAEDDSGNLPAPASTAIEVAKRIEGAGGGEEETAAGTSRAKALAAARGLLVAV